jgi:hypothetical protein
VNKPRWDVDTPELVNEQVPDRPVNVAAREVTNTARNCARSVEKYTSSAVFERGVRAWCSSVVFERGVRSGVRTLYIEPWRD